MSLPSGTNGSTGSCSREIARAAALLRGAERVVVGAGSGLSAAGGLDYGDPALARRWFPDYCAAGLRTIPEIQALFWRYGSAAPEAYWGYWSRHIWHIRYEAAAARPYLDLLALLEGKAYFVCTTNVDGQFEKAGFPREKIFAPQGDYGQLQCARPCSDILYDNRGIIRAMMENRPSLSAVRPEDVPRCPRCGAPLVPNLRCDGTFVEAPHLWNLPDYEDFIRRSRGKNLVLLELGVGFNTPGIIRYPFEAIAGEYAAAALVRINRDCAGVPRELGNRAVSIAADIAGSLTLLCAQGREG